MPLGHPAYADDGNYGRTSIASMSSWLGRPVTFMMVSSWFMVDVPGNMGLPVMSSPMMHPACVLLLSDDRCGDSWILSTCQSKATPSPHAHMSTPNVYRVELSSISGARYHLVAT